MPPFLVHLVFHPASTAARGVALALHRALNADTALPGLAVPTVLLAEDGSGFPPVRHDLDQAGQSAVIVLADDDMVIEEAVPAGRSSWPAFVADIARRCGDGKHRFLPVQLSESAWPLHDDLKSINFIRAYTKEDLSRLERRIVVELCRFLLGSGRGTRVPITVFLSHAKQDINKPPTVFREMVAHLEATQPVSAWVDSGQIEPGASFAAAIEEGVREAAVLALLTSNYSSRPWCRREILFAKKYNRPLVVVDALDSIDLRAFPYIGNVATLAWSSEGAQRAVDLLLKEQLRHLHVDMLLKRAGKPADIVLTSPPELSTVVSLPKGGHVLYPDPPLGDEEIEVLKALDLRVETPLQRAAGNRAIGGKKVALSISEADAPERVGMFGDHLDAALLEISRHLLVRGATLAYGGHLGSAGYTTALFDLVRAHQETSGLPPVERIINYVGWPLPLTREQRAKFKSMATFVRTAMPPDVAALEPETFLAEPQFFPADSPARRYAWARGMTLMRAQQAAETDARIAIGGKMGPTVTAMPDGGKKLNWYSGRIPGVAEEILLSLKADKPVYLCGAFGGATSTVIDLLQRKSPGDFTWDRQKQAPHAEAMRELYDQNHVAWESYEEMSDFCAGIGVRGLSQMNHLTEAENLELFGCRDLPRLIELLVTGLTR
jgi:SLOG cluster2/TIR domain